MRRLIRLLAVGIVSIATTVFAGPIARAADGQSGSGGASGGVIWAGVQSTTPPAAGGSRDGEGCRWSPETAHDANNRRPGASRVTTIRNGVRYRLFTRTCRGSSRLVWIPELSPRQLAGQASVMVQGRLPRPNFSFAPTIDRMVVEIGTWIWADRSSWKPISATAWIPTPSGLIWARTTATPVLMGFTTPDDAMTSSRRRSMSCFGPGLPWSSVAGDGLSSPCTFTYEHASSSQAGGVYRAETSITWAIRWTSNVGVGGVLPPFTTRRTVTVRVQELQALVR